MVDKDEYLKKQIQNLNKHLPKNKNSLATLLEKDKPRVENRDGSTHRFKKKELEFLAEIVPKNRHSDLRLPIIIRISPKLGRGTAKISGNLEKKIVREILDKEPEEEKNKLLIYRPEMRVIRQKLPTTTQYAFLVSSNRTNPTKRVR